MASRKGEMVKFAKLRCALEPNFWAKFMELKIDKYKLDSEVKIPLWGSYNLDKKAPEGRPLFLDFSSFNEELETTSHKSDVPCHGFMMNTNTFEEFKQTDLTSFMHKHGKELLDSIKSGIAIREPWRLMMFLLFSYADLKKHKYYYWASHPTPFKIPELQYVQPQKFAKAEFSMDQIEAFIESFSKLDNQSRHFFCVKVSPETKSLDIITLADGIKLKNSPDNQETPEIYFAFYDPCSHTAPGWPLRNLLCLLFWHCPNSSFGKEMKFMSVRGLNAYNYVLYSMKTKQTENIDTLRQNIFEGGLVGWETNHRGKYGPNIEDLYETMDSVKLSERAVTLNLKLMKWRLVPDLDLDMISGLRCLLLGAGTLGCSVARVLLGWGVRHITFVDNSTVSYSNPVRQSLYTHEDAVQQQCKALIAAKALRKIQPGLKTMGSVIQIPMPGHVVGKSMLAYTKGLIKELEKLYEEHDVVFLLLDSREARWLPTVLSAAYNKITINAALGFDSYTVQRHGTRNFLSAESPDLTIQNPGGKDLGCYFCNDVTQPGNSQVGRTLDQQCTVSRPGLSYIAAGLAVELLVALMQHPDKCEAKALMDDSREQARPNRDSAFAGLLGSVPHTIRGSLWSHDTRLTITHRFPSCTACSIPIINEYRNRGQAFILDACNEPNYLERLAGLEDLLKRPDLDELCYALDSSTEDED